MLSVVIQSTNTKYDVNDYCVNGNRINTYTVCELERYATGIHQPPIITLGVYKTHEDALKVFHQMIKHEQEHKIYFMPDDIDRVNEKYYLVELVEQRFGESFINIRETKLYYPDYHKTSGKYDRTEIHSFENLKDLSEFMKDNYWITDGDISLSEEDEKKLLELVYE